MEAKETHLLSLKVGSWSSTTKRPSCVISAHASSFSSSPVVTSKHFGSCTRPPRSSKGISWYSRHKLLCLSRFTPRKSCCPWMRQCVSNNLLLFCTILFYFKVYCFLFVLTSDSCCYDDVSLHVHWQGDASDEANNGMFCFLHFYNRSLEDNF